MHYNIQIHIQSVEPPKPMEDSKGYALKGIGRAPVLTEKKVTSLLEVKISATTEAEAYRRAMALLETNRPEEAIQFKEEQPHLHRASCDDSIGMRVCGFPAGPSISDKPVLPRPRSGRPIADNPQA